MKAMDTMRDDIKADISELKSKFSEFEAQHERELTSHEKDNYRQFQHMKDEFESKLAGLEKRVRILEEAPALKVEKTFDAIKKQIVSSIGAALGMGIVAFLIWGVSHFVVPKDSEAPASKSPTAQVK